VSSPTSADVESTILKGIDAKMDNLNNRLDEIFNNPPSSTTPTTTPPPPPTPTAVTTATPNNYYDGVYIPPLPAPSKTSAESNVYVVQLMKEMIANINDSDTELYTHPQDFKTDKERKESFLNLFKLCSSKNISVYDKGR